jgi:signal transduction histidine kinase
MKKKIIVGLSLYAFFFALVGVYIIVSIEKAASKFDNLIKLHQIEILREHLLLNIRGVQSDLTLRDTPYARSISHIVSNAIQMDKLSDRCFRCHHSEEVLSRLNRMKGKMERYKHALSRVITYNANPGRLQSEKDTAFRAGKDLIEDVNTMIALTSRKLTEHTQAALGRIAVTKNLLFLLIASGPLFSAGLAYIYIRSLTEPVNILLDATRKLKAGDLDHRVPGLADEFGELGNSINDMAGSLKEQMVKMRRTEQMVVAGELAAGLAHEIKNPLAGIKVAMDVLSREDALSKEDRDVMAKVIDEIKRLEVLMKNFLNFAKPPKPRFAKVNVNDILRGTMDFYFLGGASLPGKPEGIDISKDLDARIPERVADPLQLQQVLLNLFLNAVEAMPGGGVLAVRTEYDAFSDCVRIEISDSGKGIDEGIMENIFQPFFTTKPKGTGLGLAICRQLIEQQGGSIKAENNPAGGAVFRIDLPAKRVPGAEEA